ncbi:MAG: hypothetical protein KY468_15030, partial [Armatimonadetes bacterium]|nr:hypothetical protein [Armatimonadota bacterium]
MKRNADIADMFEEIADLLEVKGEQSFRVQAYRRAARSVEESATPAEVLMREHRLEELPNIGEALAAKISEAVMTGQMSFLEDLRKEVPREAHRLMEIPGIGSRTAGRLVRELGVRSIDELEEAAASGRLKQLSGMGEKTVQKILASIQRYKSRPDRIPLVDALEIVERVESALAGCG